MVILAAVPGMVKALLVTGKLAKPGNFSVMVNFLGSQLRFVGLVGDLLTGRSGWVRRYRDRRGFPGPSRLLAGHRSFLNLQALGVFGDRIRGPVLPLMVVERLPESPADAGLSDLGQAAEPVGPQHAVADR